MKMCFKFLPNLYLLAVLIALAYVPHAHAQSGICDRNMRVQNAILDQLADIDDCAEVTEDNLNSLAGELTVMGTFLPLNEGDFDNLGSLTTLNLRNNELSSLPANIFDALGSLETLNLLGNGEIPNLPEGIFDELDSLTTLNLAGNGFLSLSAGIFNNLGSLTTLSLRNENFSSLPAGIFDALGSLTTLNLENNFLSSLPAGIFNNLDSLTTLNLSKNLLTLYLENNELSSLPAGIFERLTSLETIDLRDNPGSNSFKPLANAGSDLTITVGEVVRLDATATDGGPFGSNLSFAWLQDGSDSTTVTLTDAATATPTFTVPADTPDGTVFQFDLTVVGGNKFGTLDDSSQQRLTDSDSVAVTAVVIPPGAPTTLTATPGNGQVELEWAPPGDIGGSAITHYEYRQRTTGEDFGSWTDIPDGDDDADSDAGNETRSTVTSLTNGIAYTFQVRAVSAGGGPGEATDEVTAIAGMGLGICDRTRQVQEAILDRLGLDMTVTACAEVTEDNLNTLAGGLDFSLEGITALKEGDFDDLDSLTTLNLRGNSRNHLSSLPADIFDDLTSLTTLDLGFNRLSSLPASLPPGIFDDLDSLETLDLTFNLLSSLPPGIFDALDSLETLLLLNNEISSLPEDIFNSLGSLTTLNLQLNQLSRLPEGIFNNLDSLATLILRDNQLSSLPAGIFDSLGSLTTLNLRGNQLSRLPEGIFNNLDSLATLILRDNRLSSLPAGIFERLTSLKTIDLRDNPGTDSFIPSANAGSDRTAAPDEVVMLDATATDGGPFGSNLSFAWLQDGSDSTTVTLTGAATATPTFTVPVGTPLDGIVFRFDLTVVGGNKFGTLDDSSRRRLTDDSASVEVTVGIPPGAPMFLTATSGKGQVGLEWMSPGGIGSTITHYEYRQRTTGEDFGSWTDIPDGDDANSDAGNETRYTVTSLTNGIAYTFQVRAVSAAGPGEATDEVTAIAGMGLGICDRTRQVQEGILSELSDATDCAVVADTDLNSIIELDLAGTEITALKVGDFAGLATMTTLNLSFNELSSLPAGVFDGLSTLERLYMQKIGLTTLTESVFNDLTALKELDLVENKLTTLPGGVFDSTTMLNRLYLNDNQLEMLPDDVFERLTSLDFITLFRNPDSESFKPMANAGPDREVIAGDRVTLELDGTATDGGPFGNNIEFSWSRDDLLDTEGLTKWTTARPMFIVPGNTPVGTTLRLTLTVRGKGETAPRFDDPRGHLTDRTTLTVTVLPRPKISIMLPPGGESVVEGEPAVFILNRTESANTALTVNIKVIRTVFDSAPPSTVTAVLVVPPDTVTFDAGSATTILSLATDDDMLDEPDSILTVDIISGAGYEDVSREPISVVVTDNDVTFIEEIAPGGPNGFIVDIGAADYVIISGRHNDGARINADVLLPDMFGSSLRTCIVYGFPENEPTNAEECDSLHGSLIEEPIVQVPVFGSVLYGVDVEDDGGVTTVRESLRIYVAPPTGFPSEVRWRHFPGPAPIDMLLLTSDNDGVPESIDFDFELGSGKRMVGPIDVSFAKGRSTVSISLLPEENVVRLSKINGVAFSGRRDDDLSMVTEAMLRDNKLFSLGNNEIEFVDAKEPDESPIESVEPVVSLPELVTFDQVTTITLTGDYIVNVFAYATATATFDQVGMSEDVVRGVVIDISNDDTIRSFDNRGMERIISFDDADFSPHIFQVEISTNMEVIATINALGDVATDLGNASTEQLTLTTRGELLPGFYAYKNVFNLPPLPDGREVSDPEIEVFDFIVTDFPAGVATIVIELAAPTQEGSLYYRYRRSEDDSTDDWVPFEAGDIDKIFSAPAPCPSAQASRETNAGGSQNDYAWYLASSGTRANDQCLMLEIEDGSVNDADGRVNGIIFSTGASVGVADDGVTDDGHRRGGSGAIGLWWLLLLVGIVSGAAALKRRDEGFNRRFLP